MIQIIPAVLPTSSEQYQADLVKLAKTNSLKGSWVHIDLMDNKFVPNKGINLTEIAKYPTVFIKEAHLMVQYPKVWINKLAQTGFKRVLFHLESDSDKNECIDQAKKLGLEVGLVLKHETPLDNLTPYIAKIDRVLLMAVVPGFQGQPFIEEVLGKVKEFKLRQWSVSVGVDGAIRDTNIGQLVEAGVDYVIVGSYLLKGDTNENLEHLLEVINGA